MLKTIKETEGEESSRSSEFAKAHTEQNKWRFAQRNNGNREIQEIEPKK